MVINLVEAFLPPLILGVDILNSKIMEHLLRDDIQEDRSIIYNFIEYIKNDWKKSDSKLSAPLWVGWKITPRCNIPCKHCWAHLYGIEQETYKMLKVIDKLKDAGVIHITLTGGEPFIRKDFFEILEYIKARNIHIEIFSNGWFLNERLCEKLKSILDEEDYLQVSLDGASKETHDMQRMKGSFNRVIRAMKNLHKYKIKFRVNFTATHYNVEEIKEGYILSSLYGANSFSVSPVYSSGRAESIAHLLDLNKYICEIERCCDISLNIKTKFKPFLPIEFYCNINQNYSYNEKFNPKIKLEEGDLFWSIDSSGNVFPSIDLYTESLCGGNIYEHDIEYIQNNLMKNTGNYRNLMNIKYEDCNLLFYCQGGDLGRTYRKYKSFDNYDPVCEKGVII